MRQHECLNPVPMPRHPEPGRRIRVIALAFELLWLVFAIAGCLVILIVRPGSALAGVFLIASILVVATMFFLGLPLLIRNQRNIRKRVLAAEHQPCVKCGYALVGLPRYARCPECGTAQDTDKLRAFWIAHPCLRNKPSFTFVFAWHVVLVIAVSLVWPLIASVLGRDFAVASLMTLLPLPLMGLMIESYQRWLRAHIRRRLIRARFRLCRLCGANLSRCSAVGKCPRCRRRYTWRELQEKWRREIPVDWQRDVLEPCRRAERVLATHAAEGYDRKLVASPAGT